MQVAFERNVAVTESPDRGNFIGGHDPGAGVVHFLILRGRAHRIENHLDAPGFQSFGNLIGILGGIGGGLDGFRRLIAGILMIAVAGFLAAPAVDHNLRAQHADDAHHVFQFHALPFFERFFERL